jgi:hypothetical protein
MGVSDVALATSWLFIVLAAVKTEYCDFGAVPSEIWDGQDHVPHLATYHSYLGAFEKYRFQQSQLQPTSSSHSTSAKLLC